MIKIHINNKPVSRAGRSALFLFPGYLSHAALIFCLPSLWPPSPQLGRSWAGYKYTAAACLVGTPGNNNDVSQPLSKLAQNSETCVRFLNYQSRLCSRIRFSRRESRWIQIQDTELDSEMEWLSVEAEGVGLKSCWIPQTAKTCGDATHASL